MPNNDGYFDPLSRHDARKDERMKVTRSIVVHDSHPLGRGWATAISLVQYLQLSNGDGRELILRYWPAPMPPHYWAGPYLGEDFDYNGYQDSLHTNGYPKDIFHRDYLK